MNDPDFMLLSDGGGSKVSSIYSNSQAIDHGQILQPINLQLKPQAV
jgi:hypothetical protein